MVAGGGVDKLTSRAQLHKLLSGEAIDTDSVDLLLKRGGTTVVTMGSTSLALSAGSTGVYITVTNTATVGRAGFKCIGRSGTPEWEMSGDEVTGDFTIKDNTNSTTPFEIEDGAPDGSLLVDAGGDVHVGGGFFVPDAGSDLTIATGVITVTHSYHKVDTEASAATDDLDTINGGVDGAILVLRTLVNARDVVVKHNTGNIQCGADFTLSRREDRITLQFDSELNQWCALSTSDNR